MCPFRESVHNAWLWSRCESSSNALASKARGCLSRDVLAQTKWDEFYMLANAVEQFQGDADAVRVRPCARTTCRTNAAFRDEYGWTGTRYALRISARRSHIRKLHVVVAHPIFL